MKSESVSRLQDIPVRIIGSGTGAPSPAPRPQYHGRRRAAQLLALAVVTLVPLTGLFRIDVRAGAMVILDRQIWFSDFFIVFGLWIFLATALIYLYSLAGTAFCGWACPQNSVSEWANFVTRRLLGKRAEVSLDGTPVVVTTSRRHWQNWALLAAAFLAAALVMALVPMLYFLPPRTILSFLSMRADPDLPGSLYWIYSVFVLIFLLDVTFLRHFWCRFICVYRVWQHSFKTKQTLHIAFDQSRSADCEGCNYCVTQCFIELDPRGTDVFDSCINCGECIDACDRMHRKRETPGLLSFEFGSRRGISLVSSQANTSQRHNNEYSLLGRLRWTIPFSVASLAMFAWGLFSYQPYHLSLDHGSAAAGQPIRQYLIEVASKHYHDGTVHLEVLGLDPGDYVLDQTSLKLTATEHRRVRLDIPGQLRHGLYRVVLRARSDDGWEESLSFQHLASP